MILMNDNQKALKEQKHITENYYTCTKEILHGLGQMYVADERFKNNIDKHADGTAAYVSEAIAYYCNCEERQDTHASDGL